MADELLMSILDFILNHAEHKHLEVISEAVNRRMKDLNRIGSASSAGVDPQKMAHMFAGQVQDNLQGTMGMIENSVRSMAIEMIRKEAPELTDEQIGILIKEWIPNERQRTQKMQKAMGEHSDIPAEVLKSMVYQFIRFSTGKMSPGEQVRMNEDMKDWHEYYWRRFPMKLQKLIRVYLKGQLEGEAFWAEVERFVGGGEE